MPVCPHALGSLGGGAFKAGAHLCCYPAGSGWCIWGLVCARCSGPQHGCPTTRLMRESVGRVSGSFLRPTTEPQRGARGMWSEVLLG